MSDTLPCVLIWICNDSALACNHALSTRKPAQSPFVHVFGYLMGNQVGRKGGGWQLQQLKNVCSNWILLEASVELLCPSHRCRVTLRLLQQRKYEIYMVLALFALSSGHMLNVFEVSVKEYYKCLALCTCRKNSIYCRSNKAQV